MKLIQPSKSLKSFLPLLETSATGMNLHQSRLLWPSCDDGRDTDPEHDSAGFVMLLRQIPADKALTPLKKTHSAVT